MEFFHTHISPRSVDLATQALRSTWVSEGKLVQAFERSLSSRLGLVRPVAVNSGTSALHLALILSGIGPGDEVILPPQTFIATGLVVLMQRATPVYADIETNTGNIDPESVRRKISEKTRAIIAVHWGGYPCDMDALNIIAGQHNLAVIEDAAHALGAVYRGKPVGSLSRFTAFSFQAIKHVTTGDGGALCCLRDDDHEKCRAMRWFGIDRERSEVSFLGERDYDVRHIGYKYHMNDLGAAVGLGNLEEFPQHLARRREIGARYREELGKVPGVTLLAYREECLSAYWLFTILVEERERFVRKLAANGIPASVVHQRIDRNGVFGGLTPGLAGQESFERSQISIPIHSGLDDEDVSRIIGTIREGW